MQAFRMCGYVGGLLAVMTTGAMAQDSNNRVAAHTDWSVFEETSPSQCWSVSEPKKQVNTRDGRVVAATRSATLLFVSYVPSLNVRGQVSFTGGYPYKKGSTVTLNVGGTTFELFTVDRDDPGTPIKEDEIAWSASEAEDAKIITALKRGAEAVLIGTSSRGTKTEDTFSLLGFTAAVEDAEKRCNG